MDFIAVNLKNFVILLRFLENRSISTLGSGIVALVGIIVLVGTFARINKCTGGNNRTGGHFY